MEPLLKKLLNSLKCPICQCQIDMIDRRSGYGCVSDLDHYTISVMRNDLDLYQVFSETVNVYDNKHKYRLTKKYDSAPATSVKTEIMVFKVDPEGRVNFSFKNSSLVVDKELFDFSKFNVDKAINRIRTVFTFS